jgi:hypothetical protein
MLLFSFYPQASDVGETHSLVPGTVRFKRLPDFNIRESFWCLPHLGWTKLVQSKHTVNCICARHWPLFYWFLYTFATFVCVLCAQATKMNAELRGRVEVCTGRNFRISPVPAQGPFGSTQPEIYLQICYPYPPPKPDLLLFQPEWSPIYVLMHKYQ